MDFSIWDFIKTKVHESQPADLDNLKKRITVAFQMIAPAYLSNTFDDFEDRLRVCVNNHGTHGETNSAGPSNIPIPVPMPDDDDVYEHLFDYLLK